MMSAQLTARLGKQLERIQRYDPTYNAVSSLLPDAAEQARQAADMKTALALTVGVKDVINTAGHLTAMGSPAFRHHLPAEDAAAVSRLRSAGAVISAKTHLSEFAMGATSQNQHFGAVANAWDPGRVAGGSSGGSAVAVAAGFVDAALGTDTGGSILVPSALNGVVGLRPSVGRIPNRGVFPVSVHYDTIGPIARTVATVRRVFDAIAGRDAADLYQRPPESCPAPSTADGIRIGLATNHFLGDEPVMSGVAAAAEVLENRGMTLSPIVLNGADRAQEHMARMMFADFLLAHEERFAQNPSQFGEDLQFRLRLGEQTTGVDYARGRRDAQSWRVTLDDAFRDVDVILTPTVSQTAPLLAESSTIETSPVLTRFTHPWCLWDGPTLTVPVGHDAAGMPFGMSLTGPPGAESLLLLVGEVFQAETHCHGRVPELLAPTKEAVRE